MKRLLLIAATLTACTAPATADPTVYDPLASGSATPTTTSSTGYIRRDPNLPDYHAVVEYHLADLLGMTIDSATIAGSVWVNNALDTGPRDISMDLYAGDGMLQVADFDVPGASAGIVSYWPPNDSGVTFEFDITTQLQGLLDAGAHDLGARFTPITDQAPSVLIGPELTVPPGWPELRVTAHSEGNYETASIVGCDNAVATDYDGDGVFDNIVTPGWKSGLSIQKFDNPPPSVPADVRTLIEFDTPSMPAGALKWALLEFHMLAFANAPTRVDVYGYAGDGSTTLDDATASATLLGAFVPEEWAWETRTVGLDVAQLQTLMEAGDYVGLRLQGGLDGTNTQIASLAFPDIPPRLRLIFTPIAGDFDTDGQVTSADVDMLWAVRDTAVPPTDAMYDLDPNGHIDLADARKLIEDILGTSMADTNLDHCLDFRDLGNLANRYNQTGDFGDGDANFDGVVNFVDLGHLANDYGKTFAGAPVPEPASLALLALGGVAVLRRRRRAP